MDFIISVQARLGSSRLPGKVLLPIGSRRVLSWVVSRCREADVGVVIALGDEPENEAARELCSRRGWQVSQGPEDNLLERHRSVALEYDATCLVRVAADSPFLPATEIQRLIAAHEENDARCTTSIVDSMPRGTMLDVIDTALLDELARAGETHPMRPQLNDPERWDTLHSPNPELAIGRQVSVAVDTPGDYWRLIDAVEAVGSEPRAVLKWMSHNG